MRPRQFTLQQKITYVTKMDKVIANSKFNVSTRAACKKLNLHQNQYIV